MLMMWPLPFLFFSISTAISVGTRMLRPASFLSSNLAMSSCSASLRSLDVQLIKAIESNNANEAARLIALGADVNATENYNELWTASIMAASLGHVDCLQLLLDQDADVNAGDENAKTALMETALWGHVGCLELLINHGADVNAPDKEGRTALIMATLGSEVSCLEMLLDHAADLEAVDMNGKTALDIAVDKHHNECAVILRTHQAAQQMKREHLSKRLFK